MGERRRCVNLGCGRHPMASTETEHWWNVDILDLPGVDDRVDVFRYPWPWASASVDHFRARHFLEHVPHEIRVRSIPCECWVRTIAALPDGLFAFFAEVWRCLVPGGTITCEVPWPLSFEAISDPTHTRFVTPQTATYLTSPETAADYALPFRFEVAGDFRYAGDPRHRGDDTDLQTRARREWNVIHFWEFTLRKLETGATDEW